jgi:hypothetical protein
MMLKFVILGGAACALMSAAVVAQSDGPNSDKRGMRGQPQTRAEVEARVKERFAKLDANRDGAVTMEERKEQREETRKAMKDRRFAALDANNDGSISRAEFDAGPAGRAGMRGESRGGKRMQGGRGGRRGMDGAKGFAKADVNSDGKLTQSEMTAQALARFDRLDANKDGTLSVEERRAGWEAMRGRRGKRGGEGTL